MWYLVELLLFHWLIVDILGQPALFFAALGVAIVLYVVKEVAR